MASHRNPLDPTPVWKVRVEQGAEVREFVDPWIQIDPELQVVHIWRSEAETVARPTLTTPLAACAVHWKHPAPPLPPNDPVGRS